MKKLSMFLVMVATSSNLCVLAEDTAPTMTDTSSKESMSKKMEHMPGTMMKDTEHGFKKVGHGTKKVVKGTGHEMGKMTHMGRKKKMKATDNAPNPDANSETIPSTK